MRNEERLAEERGGRKSAQERREPPDRGITQEMSLQTNKGLQGLQEMNREEERPKESSVMHTAATRGVLKHIGSNIVSNCTIVS